MSRDKMLGEGAEITQPALYEAVAVTSQGKLRTYFSGPEDKTRQYIKEKDLPVGSRWLLFRLVVKVYREELT